MDSLLVQIRASEIYKTKNQDMKTKDISSPEQTH